MRPPLAPCTLLTLALALAGAQLENSCETLSSQIHLVKVNTVKSAFIIAKICAACSITIWSIKVNKHFEPVLVCCGFFLTVR